MEFKEDKEVSIFRSTLSKEECLEILKMDLPELKKVLFSADSEPKFLPISDAVCITFGIDQRGHFYIECSPWGQIYLDTAGEIGSFIDGQNRQPDVAFMNWLIQQISIMREKLRAIHVSASSLSSVPSILPPPSSPSRSSAALSWNLLEHKEQVVVPRAPIPGDMGAKFVNDYKAFLYTEKTFLRLPITVTGAVRDFPDASGISAFLTTKKGELRANPLAVRIIDYALDNLQGFRMSWGRSWSSWTSKEGDTLATAKIIGVFVLLMQLQNPKQNILENYKGATQTLAASDHTVRLREAIGHGKLAGFVKEVESAVAATAPSFVRRPFSQQ